MSWFCRTRKATNSMRAHKALSVVLALLLATSFCPGMVPLALAEEETVLQEMAAGSANAETRDSADLGNAVTSEGVNSSEDEASSEGSTASGSDVEADGLEEGDGAVWDAASVAETDADAASTDASLAADEKVVVGGAGALAASVDAVAEESAGEEAEASVGDTSWYSQDATSFTIATAEQLAGLSALSDEGETFAGKTITLVADVDLSEHLAASGSAWTPIGSTTTPFSGTFDGTGHTISGIATTATNDNQGLFGVIKGAHISDLTVAGTVSGKAKNGGVVGQVQGDANTLSSITNCVNRASVSSTGNYAGGIAGSAGWVTIQGCVNVGSVSGSYAGGIAGGNDSKNNLAIQGCYNRGNVGAKTYVGGIVGYYSGRFPQCEVKGNYTTGKVTGTASSNRGVVVGYSNGQVKGSSNWGTSDNNSGLKAVPSGSMAALKTSNEMKTQGFVDALNAVGVQSWVLIPDINDGYPIQEWQAPANYLKSSWVTVDPAEAFFDEDPIAVSVAVEGPEGQLAEGVDYTYELLSPEGKPEKAIECGGAHTVRVTGQGVYTGVVNVAIKVRSSQITADEVTLSKTTAVYSGAVVDPGVKVVKDGETLTAGTDYEISYWQTEADGSMGAPVSSIVNAGTYTVLVRGKGDFRDKVEKTLEVTPLKLVATGTAPGLVTAPRQVPFSGEALSPSLTVKQALPVTVVLEEGRDYTVVVKDAEGSEVARTDEQTGARAVVAQEGDYTLEVKGKGNYQGEITLKFSALDPDADVWNGYIDTSWYDARYDIFTLTKPAQLAGLAALVNGTVDTDGDGAVNATKDHLTFGGKTVRLGNNLNLKDRIWATPIGDSSARTFGGTFDGAGYEITGVNAQGSSTAVSLFGYVKNGTVVNLTVRGKVESTYNSSFSYAAGVAVYATSSTFDHVTNYANVGGKGYVAGIAAYANVDTSTKKPSTFIACANYGSLSASGYVGGIVASAVGYTGTLAADTSIVACANNGVVTSAGTSTSGYAGGILGTSTSRVRIDSCVNTGAVMVTEASGGGIAGALGATTGNSTNVHVLSCLNEGKVQATGAGARVGGLVGLLNCAADISSSVSVGCVISSGAKNAGALVGARGKLDPTYVLSGISALRYVSTSDDSGLKAIGLATGGSQDVQDPADAADPNRAIPLTADQLATQDTADALNGEEGAAWSLKDGALVNAASQVEPAVPDLSKRVSKITVSGALGFARITEPAGTLQMTATVEPANALDKSISWSLSVGAENASIDAVTGMLTARRNGIVVVRATARDGSQVIGETVVALSNQYVELQSVDITDAAGASAEGTQAITDKGQTLTFKAAILPANATERDVVWSVVEGEDVIGLEASADDPSSVIVSPVKGGVATLRATISMENGATKYDEVTISVDQRLYFATVWQGNAEGKEVKIGGADRTNGYEGTGTSRDPYRYLVAARITDQPFGNPSTGASSFWGTAQSATASPAEFAIVFEQRASVSENVDPREGRLVSSMAFDTSKNKNPDWTNFGGTHKPKIAPETAFDTSTGDLRVGFAWKGDFDHYFTNWDFTFDAQGLTSGLSAEKQAKPGDKVRLTYYGNYKSGQTVGASDFAINLGQEDDVVAFSSTATVGEDGYVTFAGDQHIRYGGNYAFSVAEASAVPVESVEVSSTTGTASLEGTKATLQLQAEVLPSNATNAQIFWSVESGGARVSVDQTGLVQVQPNASNGKAIIRASSVDGSGKYGEIVLEVSGQAEQVSGLYVGNMPMSARGETGKGAGTASDPYEFPVKATVSAQANSNPYTQPSLFWGESQAASAAPAKFAVKFVEYYTGTSGSMKSSMAFDTITKKALAWTDFNSIAPRLSPVSATDESTGDLRVAFAYKGSFDTYFSDWTYTLDVVGLTAGLAENKQVKPGDKVVLTHYGNYKASQTNRGTDYSIDFDVKNGATGKMFEAVVGVDGYAVFSGKQRITCGGNYVLTIGEGANVDPNIGDSQAVKGPDSGKQSGGTSNNVSNSTLDNAFSDVPGKKLSVTSFGSSTVPLSAQMSIGAPATQNAPVEMAASLNNASDADQAPDRSVEAIGESETALAASGVEVQKQEDFGAAQVSRAALTFAIFSMLMLALAAAYWLAMTRRKLLRDDAETGV